jgi:integral membrane protein (TIGR00529 family)
VTFFSSLPAILRIFFAFLIILFAIQKKWSLGSAFLMGAIFLGLLFGMRPPGILQSLAHSLSDAKTVSLGVIVSLILVLSHSMEKAGQMQRLLDRFQGLVVKPRVNLVIFPALIGLLPMPGGAIFSAPMVKTLGKNLSVPGSLLSYINYWFRHIWEYWWPLYPGVLLTTTLADIDVGTFVMFSLPLSSVALLVGYWPLQVLREGSPIPDGPPEGGRPPLLPILREMAPIIIVIGLGLGSGAVLTPLLKGWRISIGKELGLILALLLAIGWVWRTNRISREDQRHILVQKQLWHMFAMVAAILMFKGMLEDSGAVTQVSEELLGWRIPLMPITMILPFLIGGVIGLTVGFVGTTFPIIISLVHAFGQAQYMLPYMILALVCGFLGVLLSPLHLCLLLSNAYFQTGLAAMYRHLWTPCLFLIVSAVLYFLLLTNGAMAVFF